VLRDVPTLALLILSRRIHALARRSLKTSGELRHQRHRRVCRPVHFEDVAMSRVALGQVVEQQVAEPQDGREVILQLMQNLDLPPGLLRHRPPSARPLDGFVIGQTRRRDDALGERPITHALTDAASDLTIDLESRRWVHRALSP